MHAALLMGVGDENAQKVSKHPIYSGVVLEDRDIANATLFLKENVQR